jgi:hypothetical protein
MSNGLHAHHQLELFEKTVTWHEFPTEVREQVLQVLATVCVEITEPSQDNEQEQHYDHTEDQSLAS